MITLEKKYAKLKARKKELEKLYKRSLADYQNLIKQNSRDKEDFIKYANEQIILEIIPVYNNLKTSLEHFKEGDGSWLQGIEYITKQFKSSLENSGIEEINAQGKKFDYNTMEAMDGAGENVKKQISSGYKLKGKVIIPAKVILE